MKVKPQHIWRSGILTWDHEGALCISVVFTWHLPLARKYADSMRHRRVRIGGPAVKLAKHKLPGFFLGCTAELDGDIPGVLQRFNPQATRTSIGCIRQCSFCSVPLVEGIDTLRDLWAWEWRYTCLRCALGLSIKRPRSTCSLCRGTGQMPNYIDVERILAEQRELTPEEQNNLRGVYAKLYKSAREWQRAGRG